MFRFYWFELLKHSIECTSLHNVNLMNYREGRAQFLPFFSISFSRSCSECNMCFRCATVFQVDPFQNKKIKKTVIRRNDINAYHWHFSGPARRACIYVFEIEIGIEIEIVKYDGRGFSSIWLPL